MALWLWPVALVAAYLFGSVNFAILVTRMAKDQDIRTLGNLNPGAANVGRTLGTGWGAAVLLLDISKSVVPILLAHRFVVDPGSSLKPLITLTVGAAAVMGHCKPVFYRFRGGKGIATSIGVYVMLAPLEALVALFGAAGIVAVAVRNVDHKFGPYTPILFVILAPVATTLTALFLDIAIVGPVRLGGYHWYVPASMFALSFLILALSQGFLKHRLEDLRSGRSPAHSDGSR